MTRAEAEKIVGELVKNPNLKRHLLAVEAALRKYAELEGVDPESGRRADPDVWGLAGLLHDADWEAHPDEHPQVIIKKLNALGETEIAEAIGGHGGKDAIPRTSQLAKVLFACDELCGFITAYCYLRPEGITGLEVKSVLKKLKDKSFAANVRREDIYQGALELGLPLEQHIATVIAAMTEVAEQLQFTK